MIISNYFNIIFRWIWLLILKFSRWFIKTSVTLGHGWVPSNLWYKTHQITKSLKVLYIALQLFCLHHWSHVLSREWRCSWSSADRRCSNYIRVINNSIAYEGALYIIGIDTKIEVIVVSPTTWEAHHSPRVKPEGCGELPRSLVSPQWPKSRYQFLFYHDASKHIKYMQIRVCISRKSPIKLLQISHHGKHGHRPLSQQLP